MKQYKVKRIVRWCLWNTAIFALLAAALIYQIEAAQNLLKFVNTLILLMSLAMFTDAVEQAYLEKGQGPSVPESLNLSATIIAMLACAAGGWYFGAFAWMINAMGELRLHSELKKQKESA
jgi:energy-converting hydrogenase Eha subunit C